MELLWGTTGGAVDVSDSSIARSDTNAKLFPVARSSNDTYRAPLYAHKSTGLPSRGDTGRC